MARHHWLWVGLALLVAMPGANAQGTFAQWGYAAYGAGIGKSSIVTAPLETGTEVYVGGSIQTYGADDRWQALRYSSAARAFEQVYVSDFLPQQIVRITPARLEGQPPLIAVALADATLRLYDQAGKWLRQTYTGPCATRGWLRAFAVADLDGDGWHEGISLCNDGTLAAYGPRYELWTLAGVGGQEIAVGQMDDDPAIEIATTSGKVVDSGTHSVQWEWADGFGRHLQAADIDGDGRDELVVSESWYVVWGYDVDRQLPKWSIPTSQDIGAILVTDADGDGALELLIGDGQWGSIRAYDVATQQEKWSVRNPAHGVTNIAVVDVDGDGQSELLWGAGASVSGSNHLYVADWQAGSIEWQNVHLDGPFIGPQVGDLDGDGVAEVVVASADSQGGSPGPRIIIFDSGSGKVRAMSAGVGGAHLNSTGLHDLKLRDLDGDGRPEILVAADRMSDGLIEAYRFSPPDTFSLVWSNATRPTSAPFYCVDAADVDGDGTLEVIGGVGRDSTGAVGVYLYAYDVATGQEKWRTLQMGPYWSKVTDLAIADADGDGTLEVLGMVAGGNVYVFSGADHSLEALIETQGASLATHQAGTGLQLLIGGSTGRMSVREFDGAGYAEVSSAQFGAAPLDGLHYAPGGALWVGTGGKLMRYAGEERTFESASYGAGLGRDLVFFPQSDWVVGTGLYGVHGFRTAP
jgi:hypothetical protein